MNLQTGMAHEHFQVALLVPAPAVLLHHYYDDSIISGVGPSAGKGPSMNRYRTNVDSYPGAPAEIAVRAGSSGRKQRSGNC